MSEEEIHPKHEHHSTDSIFDANLAVNRNDASCTSVPNVSSEENPVIEDNDSDRGTDDVKRFVSEFCQKHKLPTTHGNTNIERLCVTLADQAREEFKKKRSFYRSGRSLSDNPITSTASPMLSSRGSLPSYSHVAMDIHAETDAQSHAPAANTGENPVFDQKEKEQANKRINAKKYETRLRNNRRSAHASKVHREIFRRALSAKIGELLDNQKETSNIATESTLRVQNVSSHNSKGCETIEPNAVSRDFMLAPSLETISQPQPTQDSIPVRSVEANQSTLASPATFPIGGATDIDLTAPGAAQGQPVSNDAYLAFDIPRRSEQISRVPFTAPEQSFSQIPRGYHQIQISPIFQLQQENLKLKTLLEQHGVHPGLSNLAGNPTYSRIHSDMPNQSARPSGSEGLGHQLRDAQGGTTWSSTYNPSLPISVESTPSFPDFAHLSDSMRQSFLAQPLTRECETQLTGTEPSNQRPGEGNRNVEDDI